MKSILSAVILSLCLSSAVMAKEGNRGFCRKAETTADLMECIGTHYDAAVTHMETLYNTLKGQLEENSDKMSALENNQRDWIVYRDDVCALEGAVYEGGSLERVQQLDCLTRVTHTRSDHFKRMIQAGDETDLPVFASPPRWTNVLIRDYPKAYWALGQTASFDTDCDNVDEQVIAGTLDGAAIVAIADSQLTGSPVIQRLDELVTWKACSPTMPLALSKDDGEGEHCIFTLAITGEDCQEIRFSYDAVSDSYNVKEKDEAE